MFWSRSTMRPLWHKQMRAAHMKRNWSAPTVPPVSTTHAASKQITSLAPTFYRLSAPAFILSTDVFELSSFILHVCSCSLLKSIVYFIICGELTFFHFHLEYVIRFRSAEQEWYQNWSVQKRPFFRPINFVNPKLIESTVFCNTQNSWTTERNK